MVEQPTNHVDILRWGAEAWNKWRRENPAVRPELAGEDLSEMDLTGADLSEADLTDAELFQTDLGNANLKMAVLADADLSDANLRGAALYKADLREACLIEARLERASLGAVNLRDADLRGATLRQADLTDADLSSANLSEADLSGATLTRANVIGADFRNANLTGVNLTGVEHGDFDSKVGNYYGIRGLDSCFGNALYVRDAKDQDYLDTLRNSIDQTPSDVARKWKLLWFKAWGFIDYGRSLGKLALGALIVALVFGFIFHLDAVFEWDFFDYPTTVDSILTPYYFSVVTYTRLGSGGVTPTHWVGEIVLVTERILGFVTLGLLLSILANRVARRS
jgi:uncharacterized protein YjbI with pentapeptide repeats